MKKTTSEAVAFLKELGAKNLHGCSQLLAELRRRLPEEEASKVYDHWDATVQVCAESKEVHLEEMAFVNENCNRSLAESLTMHYEFFRICFETCEANKLFFGKKILECGCRNGLQSCFFGRMLPQSEILSIDDCDLGFPTADKLRTMFDVGNVEFRKASWKDLPLGETFDTVVMTRCLQRNGVTPIVSLGYVTLPEEAQLVQNDISEFVASVAERVAEGGYLVFLDYVHFGSEILALVTSLADRGFQWLNEASQRGPLMPLLQQRMGHYAPHVMFFKKTSEEFDYDELLARLVADMPQEPSKRLMGAYLDEAAQAQLQMHAGEVVAGFSVKTRREDGSSDAVASVAYRDREDAGVIWREIQTSNELIVVRYSNRSAERVADVVWRDARAVIAESPDEVLRISGGYDSVEREEVHDLSELPAVKDDPRGREFRDSLKSGMGAFEPFKQSPDSFALSPKKENAFDDEEMMDRLIDKLGGASDFDDGYLSIRLVDGAKRWRKRENAKSDAKSVLEAPIEDSSGDSVRSTPVDEDARSSVVGALKLTYFSKAGRLNVEDQSSGSQWCVSKNGILVDGEALSLSSDVSIGETGLSISTSDREILLCDEKCGYHLVIKLV